MLKKTFLLTFVMLLIFSFSGCGTSETEAVPTVPEQFEGELEIEYNDYTVRGYVKKLVPGACTFDVTYPDEISGMKVVTENGKITLNFYGIEYTVNSDRLPQSAGIKDIASVLDNMSAEISTENPDYDSQTGTLNGNVNGISYSAVFNEEGIVEKIIFK